MELFDLLLLFSDICKSMLAGTSRCFARELIDRDLCLGGYLYLSLSIINL